MLFYFHGLEDIPIIIFFILIVFFTILLAIITVSLFLVYKHIKNSKNEIQNLNLSEKSDEDL